MQFSKEQAPGMGLSPETKGVYGTITNHDFRTFLEEFDGFLEDHSWELPVATATFSSGGFARQLALRKMDMDWLVVDAKKNGILTPLFLSRYANRPTQMFDKDRCLAFGALAYAIVNRYPIPQDHEGVAVITDTRQSFPWAEVTKEAKVALGLHRLSEFLHSPSEEATQQIPTQKEPEVKTPLRLDMNVLGLPPIPKAIVQEERSESADQAKPIRIESKFPKIDSEGEAILAICGLEEINALISRLPNSVESVNINSHNVSNALAGVVMFISMADEHKLSLYNPEEDGYPLFAIRQSLEICRGYLRRYPKITNLEQLYTVVKSAVIRDSKKYW